MQLVLAEKPSVANSIAEVLGADIKEDGYRTGNGYIVTWCFGHLVETAPPLAYGEEYAKWTYDTLPIIPEDWKYEVKKDTKKQFNTIKKLMNSDGVDSICFATDAGREGELIARLTYMMAGCKKPIYRLWISSMEESAIREGFANLRLGSEYENLYRSALARQKADWLVGINGTRLFTVLYKNKVLKVGRVQSPTLSMLAERENEIQNFKKEPFYQVLLGVKGVKAAGEKMKTRQEAESLSVSCNGKTAVVTVSDSEEKSISAPKLFDLTSLQREANRLYGFTAKETLDITQRLYEEKLVTYPRTDSQFLSDDMARTAESVLKVVFALPFALGKTEMMGHFSKISVLLNSKKVTDHHAIIPTVEISKRNTGELSEREQKILYLIADRLLCATGEKHRFLSKKVEFTCEGHTFTLNGREIIAEGWKAKEELLRKYFGIKGSGDGKQPDSTGEDRAGVAIIPEFVIGEKCPVQQTEVAEKFTKAPARYTEAAILTAMEKAGASEMDDDVERKGIGTPATRADIIEKLVHDGFVKREKKQLIPTEDGIKLIGILPTELKSPMLTADWENALVQVANGELSDEDFMAGIEDMVRKLVAENSAPQNPDIFSGNGSGSSGEREVLGKCPNCGKEVLIGKFGAYCSGKCGMSLQKAMGTTLSEKQIASLLSGEKVLVRGLKSKAGKTYDAYLSPEGTESYSFTDKDGNARNGVRFKFDISFPERKAKKSKEK